MKFRPTQDRVLIQRLEAKEKTEGGIVIPETSQKRPTRGKVVAVGPGKVLDNGTVHAPGVKVDDEVVFGEYSGTEMELEGETYFVLRDEDVLAVVEEA